MEISEERLHYLQNLSCGVQTTYFPLKKREFVTSPRARRPIKKLRESKFDYSKKSLSYKIRNRSILPRYLPRTPH